MGSNRGKLEKLKMRPKQNMLPHIAIEGVLASWECAEKWCATLWDPVPQFSVSPNCEIIFVHDFFLFRQYSKGVQGKSNVSGESYSIFCGIIPIRTASKS